MNPWTIIGWVVIGGMALVATLYVAIIVWVVARRLSAAIKARVMSRRMLTVLPAAGQSWVQGDSTLKITKIAENGRIVMTTGSASWSDSPDEWRARIKERHVYLKEQP